MDILIEQHLTELLVIGENLEQHGNRLRVKRFFTER